MKAILKGCLTAVAILLSLASCDNNKFHVDGTINDAKDSILYFEHMSLDGPQVLDSVKLDADGTFSFRGDRADAPEFYRLRIHDGIINISIDSTETVKISASYPTMSTKYEVEGSDNCKKIKELAIMQQQLLSRLIAIERNTTIGVQQTRDSMETVIEAHKDKIINDYILKEPQKAYAYFALFQAVGPRLIFNPRESERDIRCFAAVATSWDTFYPEAVRGQNLHNIAIEGLKVLRKKQAAMYGPQIDLSLINETSIIDVPLVDNKGNVRSLTELKGKVVLLDFHLFAAKGSTERIMLLRELYNKYHAQGLEIYQVSIDPDEHFWKTQTEALPWINVHDPDNMNSPYLTRYNVQQVPTFFLIDRNNALYKRDAQIKDIDQEIISLLK